MIDRLEATPYRLPLRKSWQSARGVLHERTGWLLSVHSGDLCGFGDCAPLPEAGTESHRDAFAAVGNWRARIAGRSLEEALQWVDSGQATAPAASFGLECALLDLLTRQAGLPLRRWFNPRAPDSVDVNAALGPLHDVTTQVLRAHCRAGFRVLKIKVGLEDPDAELRILVRLAGRLPPGTSLRLDANGAWSFEDAARVIAALNELPVESLEEPLREPGPESLQRLQAEAAFPLALDETLHAGDTRIEIDSPPVRRIVLKPASVGGLRKTRDLAIRAGRHGVQVVLTSTIETAAGIWPTLQLAASLPSGLAHGLATSDWLARDLGDAPAAGEGRISLPERAGTGFRPSGGKHHRY